jgi:hypothetical protein
MESSWIITLAAGSSPPSLTRPSAPELAHLHLFSSRTTEEGRDRFRLHLGYFEDVQSAVRVLGAVRESHPAAWVVPAARYRPLACLRGLIAPPPVSYATAGASVKTPSSIPDPASAAIAGDGPSASVPLDDDSILETPEVLALLESPLDVRMPIARDASPAMRPELLQAFSRFSIEEWRPETTQAALPPPPRAWYERLRRVARLAPPRRASA